MKAVNFYLINFCGIQTNEKDSNPKATVGLNEVPLICFTKQDSVFQEVCTSSAACQKQAMLEKKGGLLIHKYCR